MHSRLQSAEFAYSRANGSVWLRGWLGELAA
jgi:hypothetical protein